MEFVLWNIICLELSLVVRLAFAQGGPPMRTHDRGTPGNRNWEINLACTQTFSPIECEIEAPLLDINYGLGERIQLKVEIPYLFKDELLKDDVYRRAFGDLLIGVKWRFYGQGNNRGWRISTYPQVEILNPTQTEDGQKIGRSARFLVPIEITRELGPVDINFEAGYWFAKHIPNERILGLVVGHQFTKRFEGLSEIYDDVVLGGTSRSTTFDLGGRYQFRKDLLFLFMAGRRIIGNGLLNGQPSFVGYAGLQIQLSPK
jgi:hypothetical protein